MADSTTQPGSDCAQRADSESEQFDDLVRLLADRLLGEGRWVVAVLTVDQGEERASITVRVTQ
jgi:hypothetical protein